MHLKRHTHLTFCHPLVLTFGQLSVISGQVAVVVTLASFLSCHWPEHQHHLTGLVNLLELDDCGVPFQCCENRSRPE